MRVLLRSLLACLSLATFVCSAETAAPAAADFKEGEQYKEVREKQPVPDKKRVLVEEIFWYGCPHCFHLDPQIEAWKKTKAGDVDFVRIPNSLGHAEGIVHQKAFYTAEALGIGDKIHTPLFNGIHEQHLPLYTQDAIRAFFNQQTGIMPDVFDATYNGFAVDSRVRRADGLMKAYGIASVPAIVVGGKYTTNASLAGDFDKMIKVTDFLVDKVRQEQKK
jgi:thiol:disulfide interchange protein DsbA